MKRLILGMSSPIDDVRRDVTKASSQIIDELLRIVLYRKTEYKTYIPHWYSRVYAYLDNIPTLKSSNKLPTYDQLMKWSWVCWGDSIEMKLPKNLQFLNKKYPNEVMTMDDLDVKYYLDVCEKYLTWLCQELSVSGNVTSEEVYQILDALIKK